jgi:putative Mg2+ transporter-C (MgtC) family protein
VRDRLRPEPERLRVTLQYEADRGALREVLAAAERRGLPATLLGAARIHGDSDMRATLEFAEASPDMRTELIDVIARLEGVRSVVVQGSSDDD